MKEEKLGTATELIYHNEANFYTILLFETKEEQFFAVGNMPRPAIGRSYKLLGEWVNHPKYGRQFAFSSFEEQQPTSEEGIIALLSSGIIRGIGPSAATAIVKKFGEDTLKIIEENPQKLMQVSGIGEKKAQAIAEGYSEHREYAQTMLQLSSFDISTAACMKLYKFYGSGAPDVVRENPYRLIDDIYGIGFQKADKIAQKIGFAEDSPYRVQSAVIYTLNAHANAGDTYAPERELTEEVARLIDVSREAVSEALFELALDAKVHKENLDSEGIVELQKFHKAENYCAAKLLQLCRCELGAISDKPLRLTFHMENVMKIELTEKQRDAVVSSLQNGVSIITGGPGTGKTTIIKMLLAILNDAGIRTALAAPTGRAAKRMTEATGEDAQTVHRMLEYTFEDSTDRMYFGKNEDNPIDAGCIIIDEISMVDVLLMEALLKAVRPGTRLILVGDADQLPPVGAGNVLSDMIESGVIHTSRLKDIFRQAAESMIIVNAHAINRGEYPEFNAKNTDCFFMDRSSEREIAETIKQLCETRLPAYYKNLDPYTDIQVLTPTRKGLCGSIELNKALQSVLNPPLPSKLEKRSGDRIFREGDKVMHCKNNYFIEWKNLLTFQSGQGIFNGDMGIVSAVDNDAGTISVLYDGEKLVVYDYSSLDELELAFALTVHKSQGSEFPVVVMPMTHFPPMLATRNLLYTAITRAKESVVLVGNPRMPNAMVDNNSGRRRRSTLKTRLEKL